MATALKHKLSYHRRLFLLLLVFSWTLVGCFILFQYGREKHFKAERLDAQLQLFNLRMLDAVNAGAPPDAFIARSGAPCEGVRVTLIDPAGHVVFDNSLDTLPGANHLDRPEVAEALARGTGYTIRRHSESTDRNYFYSAMRGDRYIVRSAVPYSVPLGEILAADREFLWFMLGVTLLMSVAGYFATRRLGQNITRLNEFAERAERGERIDDLPAFPHDELGEISSHIIRLYARLQKTTADRDREHALALHEEQEKIRIKKQLTNNINHELKTPVAAIQGYLETLLANPSLDAQRRTDFLEKSAAQTERLRRLLADISTITRMDEASQLIQKERVVLNDLIAEVTADMELKPADQRLRVNIDFPQQVEIVGSPSLLASIFRNLADNAAAYSGGRDIFIRLLSDTPEECTVSFADNGIGIGEEHLPHIFERFYRIDKGRHGTETRRPAAAGEHRLPAAGRDRRQPVAAGINIPQPRGQRRGLFRRTRHLHPAAFRHPRRVHGLVRRQRHRHRRGAPAAHLRTLLPHRQGPIAQTGRHGTGAGDRQKRRCDPRRHDHGPRTRTRRAGVRLHIEETQLTNSSYTTTRPAAFAAFGCDYESEPPLTPRLGGELRRKNATP